MAAAISLAASIVALVGAADAIGKTLSKARILYRAPDEVLALNNEIADLTVVMRNLENHPLTTAPVTMQESISHMKTLVERARDRILQLDQLIHYEFLKSGNLDGDYKVFRLRWARSKDTVENHRQALRDAKQNIVIHMLAIDASFQGRTRLIIDDVFATTNRVLDRQLQSSEFIAQQLRYQSQLLDGIQATQRSAIQDGHERFATQARLLEGIANRPTEQSNSLQPEARDTRQIQPLETIPFSGPRTLHNESVIGIRARVARGPAASHQRPGYYTCSCRTPASFRTPRLFDKALGGLFVGYSGYPSAFTKCAKEDCQAGFSARVTYTFPFWLFWKMIDICLALSKYQDPCLSITVRAIVPVGAEVFRLTRADDRIGLEKLFSSGGARPNDIIQYGDRSALHEAIELGKVQALEALLRAGADPHHRPAYDRLLSSPFHLAWTQILSKTCDHSFSETLRALFPHNDDYLEEFQFSRLHSMVLGLIPGRIEEELAQPGVNINATDYRGRTALSWAIQRRDHHSTRLLLHHKADPTIASFSGDPPAAHAARRQDVTGLRLLLAAGASVTQRNRFGRNCLHHASVSGASCDMLEILIAAGCDVNAKDYAGSAPLDIAAQTGSATAALRTLLNHGSDINAIDLDGDCPLFCALFEGRDEHTQFLLDHGAGYTIINNDGHTILHHAALSGSLTTLEILRSADLSRIDPNAKNKKGKTALQLVQERVTKPEGFINLFLTLLFEIRCRNDAIASKGGKSLGAESSEARELSEIVEIAVHGNSPERASAEPSNEDINRDVGAAEPGRDDDGENREAFFDALEQQ